MDSPSESAPPNESVAPGSPESVGDRYGVLRKWHSVTQAVGNSIRQNPNSLNDFSDAYRENLENLAREYRNMFFKPQDRDQPNQKQPDGDQ